jgi:hypothetical protein
MMAHATSFTLLLGSERAPHGARIVATLLRQLSESTCAQTVLPPPDVLHRKLHEAIETARARIEAKDGDAGQEKTA